MLQKERPELSRSNKYWIDKNRHYELKHFCLQYPWWKVVYRELEDPKISTANLERMGQSSNLSDITAKYAIAKESYGRRFKMIEDASVQADAELADYILLAVTKGLSYENLKTVHGIPCCRETYYDRYRKFFYILSGLRD